MRGTAQDNSCGWTDHRLTRALEVGDVQRFSSIKKATSCCGLCGAENTSANTVKRIPLSKQRNKHPQLHVDIMPIFLGSGPVV
jgi:hypothetical protein